MAKWVYQMTPHDEWDYDGVNEMILADSGDRRQHAQDAGPLRPQRLRLHLDRGTGELLVAEKFDPAVNWATGVDMNKNSPTYGRPQVVAAVLDRAERRGRQHQGHLPGGARHQGPAAGRLLARDRPVLRADQPRLHGLRAVQGDATRPASPMSARRCPCIRPRATSHMGNFIAWDATHRQDRLVEQGAVLGVVGRAGDRRRRGLLRHARRLSEGRRRQDRQGTLQVQDPVGHHRQRQRPTSTTASSTSPSCRASAAGPASAWRPA